MLSHAKVIADVTQALFYLRTTPDDGSRHL
jgi:hypothetical protein